MSRPYLERLASYLWKDFVIHLHYHETFDKLLKNRMVRLLLKDILPVMIYSLFCSICVICVNSSNHMFTFHSSVISATSPCDIVGIIMASLRIACAPRSLCLIFDCRKETSIKKVCCLW